MSWWRALLRQRRSAVGIGILAVLVLAALVGPELSPYNPYQQNLNQAMLNPSLAHPFGTDYLGRDLLTRVMLGGRISLLIGLAAVAIGFVIGGGIGLISGYVGGWIDSLIQRVTDAMFAFSTLLLSLALVAILGPGLKNVIVAVGVGVIPSFIRLARAQALLVVSAGYIDAAQLAGVGSIRIVTGHILRNTLGPLIVQTAVVLGTAILAAAGLGFLGLGVQEPQAEWGAMLGSAQQYVFAAPRMLIFPGAAISLAVIAFNFIGDGLRDALDPRQREALSRG